MTEMPGVVISTDEGFACVEIGPRAVGCGRCHEAGGCGSDWSASGKAAKRVYRLPNGIGARRGDDVVLTMADGALLSASLRVYFLPIIVVIAAAAIGAKISEFAAIAGALIGFAIGMVSVRYAQAKMMAAREPLLSMRIKPCAFNLPKGTHTC